MNRNYFIAVLLLFLCSSVVTDALAQGLNAKNATLAAAAAGEPTRVPHSPMYFNENGNGTLVTVYTDSNEVVINGSNLRLKFIGKVSKITMSAMCKNNNLEFDMVVRAVLRGFSHRIHFRKRPDACGDLTYDSVITCKFQERYTLAEWQAPYKNPY